MSEHPTSRRLFIGGMLGAIGAVSATGAGLLARPVLRQPKARVTALRHRNYDSDLSKHLEEGIRRYPAVVHRVKDGRVVLKPNFVEFHEGRPINTDVRFVAACVEAFRRLGASEVLVGEGPGHLRDTEMLLEATGLGLLLKDVGAKFVDLNVDEGKKLVLPNNYSDMSHIAFAKTAVTADLLVSVAKMKTHHWAGATLTMKNLFGIVPSAIYGWPKNPLHWAGIQNCILDIWDAVRPGFGIVDGIVAMEGDGPIMGTARPMGAIFMGDNLPAVDAHVARMMGLIPERIPYLAVSRLYGGTLHPWRTDIEGDVIQAESFEMVPSLAHLQVK